MVCFTLPACESDDDSCTVVARDLEQRLHDQGVRIDELQAQLDEAQKQLQEAQKQR